MPPLSTSNDGATQKDMNIEETGGQRSQDEGGVSPEDLLRFSWQIASGMVSIMKFKVMSRVLSRTFGLILNAKLFIGSTAWKRRHD